MLMDASTTPDSAIMLMEGGTDGALPEAGSDSSSGCPPAMVPAPAGAACARATATCLQGATTQQAQQACVAMDPNPGACQNCIIQEVTACASSPSGGCGQAFGDVVCCGEANCAGQSGQALEMCLQTSCQAEAVAQQNCLAMAATRCPVTALCFM